MIAPDAVDSPETLNQAHRIPMEIVVDDLVAILKIQAFRQNVRGNQRVQFGFARRAFVLGIRFRRKPPNNPNLAFIAAVDYVDVVPLVAGVYVVEKVRCCLSVLREDEPLSFANGLQQCWIIVQHRRGVPAKIVG